MHSFSFKLQAITTKSSKFLQQHDLLKRFIHCRKLKFHVRNGFPPVLKRFQIFHPNCLQKGPHGLCSCKGPFALDDNYVFFLSSYVNS